MLWMKRGQLLMRGRQRNEKASVTGIQNAESPASNIVSKSLALAESLQYV
ncbi:hypothetical protein NQ504_09490 [Ligilactobacillus ruminis]|nr:hypothetical protein [Ligilactobacillus ruminis]UWP39934.1 hypothetical protein NQ504_09490 [Ligilactobacillus ruminis]